jgi:hypothetical protein
MAFWFLEFCFAKLPRRKQGNCFRSNLKGMDAGCDTFMSFCGAKTHSPETAWMPFQGSARDRSGILFCRRQKRYKRIARFFAQQKMRPK